MDKFAKMALEEYNSAENVIRPGGVDGRNFWNNHATQFMFPPSFSFPTIPAAYDFEFFATDSTGKTYSFKDNYSYANLSPIWKDLAPGMVELKVEAIHSVNGQRYLLGARTFYKATPFPGREVLPKKACTYTECAKKALAYAFRDPASQYWLKHGVPDPEYYHNVYPSKMISSLVKAMIAYAKLEPSMAKDAMKLATNAADFLLSITYGADTAVEGLPPTYCFKGLNRETVNKTAPMAERRENTLMLIYPASVGEMYLELEKATGDKKYFEAAKKIAEYYKNNVLENGSWNLLVYVDTNEPESNNCCCTFAILNFLNAFYKRTKDEVYNTLEKNFFKYIIDTRLETFNWEGQFEDIALSGNFKNLTHFVAGDFIKYIAKNHKDNEEMMKTAKELLRFVEDQFVVWGEFAPWSQHYTYGESVWYSPAALEQYYWYVPIDGSTASLINDFLAVYNVTKDELLLEKACALGDSITRMQNKENGVIPTHWMKKDCAENLENFWINCHIGTAFVMMKLAEITGEI